MPIERAYGKGKLPEDEAQFLAARRKHVEAESQPMPGEREPSREQRQVVQTIIEILQLELRRLGVDVPVDLRPEQFHFFSEGGYRKAYGGNSSTTGAYSSRTGQFILKDHGQSAILHLRLGLHEALHAMSFHAWDVSVEQMRVSERRVGYGQQSSEDLFRGFNEGMTELLVAEFWHRYESMIAERMNMSREDVATFSEQFPYRRGYRDEMDIMRTIASRLIQEKGFQPTELFETVERGYFTGEMMHLREIEKVYGEGSLRVLARLGSHDYDDTKGLLTKAIGQYFGPMEEDKRIKLQKRILAWSLKRKE